MARGMVGRSDRERDLEHHIESAWGPSRRERFMSRLLIVSTMVIILVVVMFVVSVTLHTAVEEQYAVVYSSPSELYIGILDISQPAWDDLEVAEITLTLDIPAWKVHVIRELTYFNKTSDGQRLDYLRMPSISGQVAREVSGKEVDFELRITIVTPSPEVDDLKFLGTSNVFKGRVTNDPDKPLVELTSAAQGVHLKGDSIVEVRNSPNREDVEYWFLQFTRTRLS
jgi:hypothetical protein